MDPKKDLASRIHRELTTADIFPAHIRIDGECAAVQTVEEHCLKAAEHAMEALNSAGLANCAYLAGLMHDAGKMSDAFRSYLIGGSLGKPVRRGSVNHTFAGVRLILEREHGNGSDPMQKIAAEHIAYAIGAHHGLFDLIDIDGVSGFDYRLIKSGDDIDEAVRRHASSGAADTIERLLPLCAREIARVYAMLSNMKELKFYSGLISRLLLSAVIEGDRRDTAEFMLGRRQPKAPELGEDIWQECLRRLEDKLLSIPQATPIAVGRAILSERCKAFARRPGGIYRLNLPTGAGKTLSSLRFALAHAQRHNKRRIFFVIPLLAIIEQNAKIIREAIGDDSLILEHHSNVLPICETGELDERELLAESWEAPIIITTLVQMLNTMFSHKTACIRRFHSLCGSVIVFDEVQTVPPKMLSLFNQTLVFLSEVCGATIVLCSATQPALEQAARPLPYAPEQIVPRDEKIWKLFRRTYIENQGTMSLDEIAAFSEKLLEEKDSLLIVCNLKSEAALLYQKLQRLGAECFHMSSSMCMAHRLATLEAMEQAKKRSKVLCVSTQVLEAGVDISFACVIRLQAGMDSVVQAAGRCNRNGESPEPGRVFVIRCAGENLPRLPDIKNGRKATADLFSVFNGDYSSDEAISQYYSFYYGAVKGGYQDCYCKDVNTSLYSMLSDNRSFIKSDSPYFLNQAYKTAGLHFSVFDEDTTDVIVPHGKGVEYAQDLFSDRAERDWTYLDGLIGRLKPYTVSIYSYQKEQLESLGALIKTKTGILVLRPEWYDASLGLLSKQPGADFWEV